MAADVALLSPNPGGAAPGREAVGRARTGLVTEAAGSERKGLAPTAERHARACLGLNLARGRDEPARREARAPAARATATDAVRSTILSPTSRRHLDRFGPAVNLKTVRRSLSPTPEPTPPGLNGNPTVAAENRQRGRDRNVSGFGAPAGRERDRRDREGVAIITDRRRDLARGRVCVACRADSAGIRRACRPGLRHRSPHATSPCFGARQGGLATAICSLPPGAGRRGNRPSNGPHG